MCFSPMNDAQLTSKEGRGRCETGPEERTTGNSDPLAGADDVIHLLRRRANSQIGRPQTEVVA
jgi:hypothetical protein